MAPSDGMKWGEDHRYRDRILHGRRTPVSEHDLAVLSGFIVKTNSHNVQGMQAPSVQAVTGGHGECECGDCNGFTAAWDAWAEARRG